MSIETSPDLPPLALIAGPTASGKSDLAVRLGQRLEAQGTRAVVLNADSAQVYADLRVLSARPSEEEMGGIEHRLFGAWDGATACSAADWAEAAKREIVQLHAEGAVPILCGGTGLYMRTLLEGIAPVPPIDPDVRKWVRRLSSYELREEVEQKDPAAAERIGVRDIARLGRALEVVMSTGLPLIEWQKEKTGGISDHVNLFPLLLLPPREWLYDRCNRRFEWMLSNGAIAEVERLVRRNLDPSLPVMRAIGVPEIAEFLDSGADRRMHIQRVIDNGQAATRQYAKRQYTWFRNQPPEWWPREDNKTIDEYDIFVSLLRRAG